MSDVFDLPHLITDAIADVQPTADDKGVHVAAHNLAAMPQWVEGDESAFRRALLNTLDLVVGAATGGTVHLRLAPHEPGPDRWICVVGWRGDGDEAIDEVKAAFIATLRADESTERVGPLRVLVVDDSAQHRAIVAAYLAPTGHVVTEAGSGEEATEHVRAGTFDVVLMDLQMPGMSGVEAIRQIRELEIADQRPRAYIVALSAMGAGDDATESEFAGADDCLPKPLGRDALLRALSTVPSSELRIPRLSEQTGFSPADTVGLKPDGSEEKPDGTEEAPDGSDADVGTDFASAGSLNAAQLLALTRHLLAVSLTTTSVTQVERLRMLGQHVKTRAGEAGLSDIAHLAAALEVASAGGSPTKAQTAARALQAWVIRSGASRS